MTTELLERRLIPTIIEEDDVYYPDEDGEPMGETGIHVRTILCLYYALRILFGTRPDIYVAADMFFYYEKGNPRAVKAPDVMLVKGVRGNHERNSFKTWVEAAIPAVIFEITSPSTWSEDPNTKKMLYRRLGVREYFMFDPLEELLDNSFQGFRLIKGEYVPLPVNRDGTMTSRELGAKLRREGYLLRVIDPATGEPVPWEGEVVEKIREADRRAAEAAQRADAATQQAAEAAQRAIRSDQRAAAAEAEAARLRALLEQLQSKVDDG